MPGKLLLPNFLVPSDVETAMENVSRFAISQGFLKRETFHIVMLVPSMDTSGTYPDYPIKPHLLAEYTRGDKRTWGHDLANIAQCKALQLWHGRNDGGTDSTAHLLFPGDTPFWGGVKRSDIVVACSGVQPWFDRMISGMVADMCIAMAQDLKEEWIKNHSHMDFIPE